jgi:hypothetical protein
MCCKGARIACRRGVLRGVVKGQVVTAHIIRSVVVIDGDEMEPGVVYRNKDLSTIDVRQLHHFAPTPT